MFAESINQIQVVTYKLWLCMKEQARRRTHSVNQWPREYWTYCLVAILSTRLFIIELNDKWRTRYYDCIPQPLLPILCTVSCDIIHGHYSALQTLFGAMHRQMLLEPWGIWLGAPSTLQHHLQLWMSGNMVVIVSQKQNACGGSCKSRNQHWNSSN